MFRSLFRAKSIDEILETSSSHALKRALGPVHVTLLGVGAIIGAGIYTTIGTAVTVGSYSSATGGGRYVIAWGAIVFGAAQFIRGIVQYTQSKR